MSEPKQHSHRPTQKQVNKRFKSKHSTKSALRDQAKGRTHKPTATIKQHTQSSNNKMQAAFTKHNRKNHRKQLMLAKNSHLDDLQQLFATKKQGYRVQRVVAVVPLTSDVDAAALADDIVAAVGAQATCQQPGTRSAEIAKFHNQSLRFLLLPNATDPAAVFSILDGCAAADFVVFGVSSSVEVDYQAETVVRALTGFGVGSTGGVFGVVNNLPSNMQLASSTRASLQSYLNHFFPAVDKITCVASPSETSNLVRTICEKVPKGIKWREARPRVLAERVSWTSSGGDDDKGTLVVEGTVRGARLSANRLVHLAKYGDFKIDKIFEAPSFAARKIATPSSGTMDTASDESAQLSAPDDDADSLASTNVPDLEDFGLNEQTWPTEEEMASAPAAVAGSSRIGRGSDAGEMLPPARPGTTPRLKKVPKGTSAYQAAWIIDESDGEYDHDEDDDDEDERMDDAAGADDGSDVGNASGGEEIDDEHEFVDPSQPDESDVASTRPYDELSPEQEEAQLQQYLADRARERSNQDREDMDFPDEIDTPMDIPARERFARFRGLKSFRTSSWDPYEELPVEYSRCFMFEDFKIMGKKMERKAQVDGVEAGTRVIIHIKDVPKQAADERDPSLPFVVFGLLKHEHKYSVMHFTITRNTEYSDTVRSKDPLVAQIGFRRFVVNPIFSQHTMRNNGRGANNVHKFERFLRHSGVTAHVATAYMPITFGNVPAVLLRLPSSGANSADAPQVNLVGSGALLSSDPTRITAKRYILTGHPFKVHKKTATIRYMFFNRDDIEYFKPIQLRTKLGRTGYIREPLGTHGYYKAAFDGPVSQMDTVCLNLYKRCYPKWSQVWDGSGVAQVARLGHEDEGDKLGDVDMA
ncbi:ribosome biogenesis protein tsr1 [Microbotryomycetes sp. JL201]|nr:ribosome biogenesis protein tsr1 [Microbotryomycetes sp. JL201]